jgi:hypothetical protein
MTVNTLESWIFTSSATQNHADIVAYNGGSVVGSGMAKFHRVAFLTAYRVILGYCGSGRQSAEAATCDIA